MKTRTIDSPYLTSREAVAYLRLPSLSSLYSHIRENRLPVLRAVVLAILIPNVVYPWCEVWPWDPFCWLLP